MSGTNQMELGLTIPLQRHLHAKALPYGQEPNRRQFRNTHNPYLLPAPRTVLCFEKMLDNTQIRRYTEHCSH